VKNKNSLIAVLDANVLYPAPLRDLLHNLAFLDVFNPKWTSQIQNEWISNLLINRKDLRKSQLTRTVNLMNQTFSDANIINYSKIEREFELLDKNDKHGLAAAIKSESKFIVTFNIKDFPKSTLSDYNIERITPDDFIMKLIKQNEELVNNAFENQRLSLKNPTMTKSELLNVFKTFKLTKTIARLRKSDR